MKNNLIVKSNQVVEAGYELGTNEQRLVLLGISKMPKGQEIDIRKGYEITAQEFATAYNIHPKTAYRELKEASNKLYERSINIRTEKQTLKVRWASMIVTDNHLSNDEDWKRVVIFFSPQIAPYLANLKENFTHYLFSDISNVSGAYTIRFYEFFCQYRAIKKREITIKDLRFMLNINDKYPLFSDFRRWVIEPSIKEINDKTPMHVSYELVKKGKTVASILFKFKQKPTVKTVQAEDKPKQLSEKQLDMFADKLAQSPKFQNHYRADVGASIEEYAQVIKQKLKQPEQIQEWLPHLKEVGYKVS